MSSKIILIATALGLVASGANAATVRSADTVSAPRAAVNAAPAKLAAVAPRADVGCFVALQNGRMPKLSEIRKAKAASACTSNGYSKAAGSTFFAGSTIASTLPSVVISSAVGAGVAYGVSEANKQDYSAGGNR
jgi:hypothetical protein